MKLTYVGFLLATILTAGIIWLSPVGPLAEHWLVGHWANRLDNAPDHKVAAYLDQMALLDGSGLETLVDAMASPREVVSTTAGQTLHQLLDRWKRVPVGQSSLKIAKLASLLARDAGRMDRTGRVAAADLAQRILEWPVYNPATDRALLIINCDTVIRLAVQNTPPTRAKMPRPTASESESRLVRHDPTLTDLRSEQTRTSLAVNGPDTKTLPLIPGGDLPVSPTELPPLPPSLAPLATPHAVSAHLPPGLMPGPPEPLPPSRLPDTETFAIPVGPVSDPAGEPRKLDFQSHQPTLAIPPESASAASSSLELLSDRQLIQRLGASDTGQNRKATNELRRRGLRDSELRLAKMLNTSDTPTRRRFVESLANLPISSRRWLLYFSQDENAEVRLAAAIRMATSRDSVLHQRLRVMRQTESDEEVRRQLDRWAESQSDTYLR